MDQQHDVVDEVVRVIEHHMPILWETVEVHAENHLKGDSIGQGALETRPAESEAVPACEKIKGTLDKTHCRVGRS